MISCCVHCYLHLHVWPCPAVCVDGNYLSDEDRCPCAQGPFHFLLSFMGTFDPQNVGKPYHTHSHTCYITGFCTCWTLARVLLTMPHLFYSSQNCSLRLFYSIRVWFKRSCIHFLHLPLFAFPLLSRNTSPPFPLGVYKALFSALMNYIFIDCLMLYECLFKMFCVLCFLPLIKVFWVHKIERNCLTAWRHHTS